MFHFGYKHDDHIQIKKTIHNNINLYLKSKDKANKEGKTNK